MFFVIQMVFPTSHPICGGHTNPFDITVKNTGWLAAGNNCWLPHLPLPQHIAALDIFLELSLTILIHFLCLLFYLPVLLPVPHFSQWMHIILWRWWQHCLEPSSLNAGCRNFAHSCKMSLRLDASWWQDKNWMFLELSILLESQHVWWAVWAHAVPKTWGSWSIAQLTSCSVVTETGHTYLHDINLQWSAATNMM